MKICFMCDLHLPSDKNALQYDVLNWAIDEISKSKPDCIVFAGDVTCDGTENVYDYVVETVKSLSVPFLYIPGNSDLRCTESADRIRYKASDFKNTFGNTTIYTLNDSDMTIDDKCLEELCEADKNSIVFMHHPPGSHLNKELENVLTEIQIRKNVKVFFAHLHRSEIKGNSVSLQAMDPDKCIGECPCITYYDTADGDIFKAYYNCPLPKDMPEFFGVSCYRVVEQIEFAIKKRLKFLELRPNCVDVNEDELKMLIDKWRISGGENLSVHLPDVGWKNGDVWFDEKYDNVIGIVKLLKADRVTQHVPDIKIAEIISNPGAYGKICNALALKLNSVEHSITVGIENMHMTANDIPEENRRFGYVPDECLDFMHSVSKNCRHKTGINFDIGHARNNMPYSQKYQISTWFSQVGKYVVGYHIHQVTLSESGFENHMPITDIYGHLISYASFFRCWDAGWIKKAPVVFEMRPQDAYEVTLKAFEKYN